MAASFSAVCPSLELLRSSSSIAAARVPCFSARLPPAKPLRLGFSPAFAITRLRREESLHVVRATAEQAVSGQADEDVCELVSRLELTLGEGESAINAYLVKAMKNNNGAAVLLLTDVFGFNNNDNRDFAYRLSCFGYNVLVPDLFRGMPWSKNRPMTEFEDWRAQHPSERVEKDISTAADWLMEEIAAAGVMKKLGLLGFCFGGGRVLEVLAKDSRQQYATAVCFYPTRTNEALATQITVPVLFIAGDRDELCAPDKLRNIKGQIVGGEVRVYPGRGHGFAHCPTPDDDEDAEDAFVAMKAWLHDKLVVALSADSN